MPGGSGTAVRAAVANYLTSANITNLAKVYANAPFDTGDIPWSIVSPPGEATNAIGVVWLDQDDDTLVAMDGAGGRRVCTYDVTVEMLLVDTSGDPAAAQGAQDSLIDAVKARLRTDPALGLDPNVSGIISAAVKKLLVERGRPIRPGQGNGFGCWTGFRFQVDSYEYST